MKHFVGIDNSKLTHSVSIIDENENLLKAFDIENNYEGFENLKNVLLKFENPVIAFELPHGPLIDYLRKLSYKIFSLNPLKVKDLRKYILYQGTKLTK